MWFIYAISASLIWGISYAASGRAIERGVSPVTFFFLYALTGCICAGGYLLAAGKVSSATTEVRGLGDDTIWLVVAIITSAVGALLIYLAIGEKNATVASLIEISYPLFVAFFAWLFFREVQFNTATLIGAALIISGVGVVFLSNRNS